MIEAELKITLDEAGLARLRRSPVVARLRMAPGRTQDLVSVYYDTPDHALAAAGVSLRLRRSGRAWVQTVKRRAGAIQSSGFFAHEEDERPAPGGRLVLDGPDPDGALAAVRAAAEAGPLTPVFETRVRRRVERLATSDGAEVELALDEGETVAGGARAPIREAEIERVSGEVGAVFAVARALFPTGPVRFSAENKAARGYELARTGALDTTVAPRGAGSVALDGAATVEAVARDILRDCLAQVATNLVVVEDGTAIEGPHQLRVGLRRLRTAFGLFQPILGGEAMTALAATAQALGQDVGALRDADVLLDEVVAEAVGEGLDADAVDALAAALAARREAIRARVRATLAAGPATGFLFDLAAFIEARGWLAPTDYGQSARLATAIEAAAPAMLRKRHRRVMKTGRRVRELDTEGLHDLRKQLKKLRYAVDMLGSLYDADAVAPYLRSLKDLQDAFGSMNDAAMARHELSGADAPARADPDAQRAVGWVLGTLAAREARDRPDLFDRWDRLAGAKTFW